MLSLALALFLFLALASLSFFRLTFLGVLLTADHWVNVACQHQGLIRSCLCLPRFPQAFVSDFRSLMTC
jgi:hypothetical protein